MFTEANPDKGTETIRADKFIALVKKYTFTEANPDKGTETAVSLS